MIIVEGPDGAGKTTLINQLCERFGLEVAPRVVTKDAEAMVDLKDWVEQNIAEGFQYKIFDRHRLISEFIYGPLLRKEQQPGFTDLIWSHVQLRRLYNDVQPFIIYCLPPLDEVKHNLEGDAENKVVADHVEAMYTAYVHRINLDWVFRPAHTLVWDYTTDWMVEMEAIRINEYPPGAHPLNAFNLMIARAKERAGL